MYKSLKQGKLGTEWESRKQGCRLNQLLSLLKSGSQRPVQSEVELDG